MSNLSINTCKHVLCTRQLSPFLRCDIDKLTIQYIGGGNHAMDFGTARANRGFKENSGLVYFEVDVLEEGSGITIICSGITIGYTHKDFSPLLQLGSEQFSYGFCSDGTKWTFLNGAPTSADAVEYSVGDTVGCLWDTAEGWLYITKNGKIAAPKLRVNAQQRHLYPAISMHTTGSKTHVNLDGPFKFDLQHYKDEEYRRASSQLDAVVLAPSVSAALVCEFLVHYGYYEAFSALQDAKAVDKINKESVKVGQSARYSSESSEYDQLLAMGVDALTMEGAGAAADTQHAGRASLDPAYFRHSSTADDTDGGLGSDVAPPSPYAASVLSAADATPMLRAAMSPLFLRSPLRKSRSSSRAASFSIPKSPYFADVAEGGATIDAFDLPPPQMSAPSVPPIGPQAMRMPPASRTLGAQLRAAVGAGTVHASHILPPAPHIYDRHHSSALALFHSANSRLTNVLSTSVQTADDVQPSESDDAEEAHEDDGYSSNDGDDDDRGADDDGEDNDDDNDEVEEDDEDHAYRMLEDVSMAAEDSNALRRALQDRLASIFEQIGTPGSAIAAAAGSSPRPRLAEQLQPRGCIPPSMHRPNLQESPDEDPASVYDDTLSSYGYGRTAPTHTSNNCDDSGVKQKADRLGLSFSCILSVKVPTLQSRGLIRSLILSNATDSLLSLVRELRPELVLYPPHAAMMSIMLNACKVLRQLADGDFTNALRIARTSLSPFIYMNHVSSAPVQDAASYIAAAHVHSADYGVSGRLVPFIRLIFALFAYPVELSSSRAKTLLDASLDATCDVFNQAMLEHDITCHAAKCPAVSERSASPERRMTGNQTAGPEYERIVVRDEGQRMTGPQSIFDSFRNIIAAVAHGLPPMAPELAIPRPPTRSGPPERSSERAIPPQQRRPSPPRNPGISTPPPVELLALMQDSGGWRCEAVSEWGYVQPPCRLDVVACMSLIERCYRQLICTQAMKKQLTTLDSVKETPFPDFMSKVAVPDDSVSSTWHALQQLASSHA